MSCAEFNQRVLAACTGSDTVFAGPDCTRAVLRDVAVARRCIHGENDLNWPPFSRYLCQSSRDRALDAVCDPSPGGQRAAPPAVPVAPGADGWTLGPVGVAGTATAALVVGALGQAARAEATQRNTRTAFGLKEQPLNPGNQYLYQRPGTGSRKQDASEMRRARNQDASEIPDALKPQHAELVAATRKAHQQAEHFEASRQMLNIIARPSAAQQLASDILQNLALPRGKTAKIRLSQEALARMKSSYPHFIDATLTVTVEPHASGSDSWQVDRARTSSRGLLAERLP